MFYPAFSGGSTTVNIDVAKADACKGMIGNGCIVPASQILIYNFDADMDNQKDPTATPAGSHRNHSPGRH